MIRYLIFDTETTGLNIRTDKPFMFQYGLVDEKLDLVGVDFYRTHDTDSHKRFVQYVTQVPTLVGHNIKFDVNMALNFGIDPQILIDKKYIDTAMLARLVISHDIQKDATFSTALKKLAVRYLGMDSADEERQLKAELSSLTMAHKQQMKDWFIKKGVWDTTLSATKQTSIINQVYNKWNKVFHLYPQLREPRKAYLKAFRAPNYSDCSNIDKYAITDIHLTHGLFKLWYPEVVRLDQVPTLMRVSDVIYPLADMERAGLVVDVRQLLLDRKQIISELNKTKIIDPRTGQELSIGQHAKLKELYEYESGMMLKSADKKTRKQIAKKSPAARAASYIAKMDKYLSTYMTAILNQLVYVDGEYKVFTQYNLAGTVTGRLSSNFQQFPREALELANGYKVNIRSWFVVPKDKKYMFYFDYSQMELRLQCEWTNIINGEPDINMARAFQPFKCVHYKTGEKYVSTGTYDLRPGHPTDMNREDLLKAGWSVWQYEDTGEVWKPTDLHALTTKNAFPNVDESHADWKHYRGLGKMTNFAVNYGASAAAVSAALDVDFPTGQALVNGYKKAFAGVVAFGKWLQRRTWVTDNIPNLMLRRYYSRNKHLMQNWLVQGSGADILLDKIAAVFLYIKDKPHWQLFLTVHDEVALYCDDIPKPQLNKEVKEIQELMTHKLSAVDITVDVEVTETCWADKKDWKGV